MYQQSEADSHVSSRTDRTGKGARDGILAIEEANSDSHVVPAVEGGQVSNGSWIESSLEGAYHEPHGNERIATADERVRKGEDSPPKLDEM